MAETQAQREEREKREREQRRQREYEAIRRAAIPAGCRLYGMSCTGCSSCSGGGSR